MSISPAGCKPLAVAFVYGLSQLVGAAVVGVVPSPAAIYAITTIANGHSRFDLVISRRYRPRCSKLYVPLVPLFLAFLFGLGELLLLFFLLFLILFVMISVSLSLCCTSSSQNRQ